MGDLLVEGRRGGIGVGMGCWGRRRVAVAVRSSGRPQAGRARAELLLRRGVCWDWSRRSRRRERGRQTSRARTREGESEAYLCIMRLSLKPCLVIWRRCWSLSEHRRVLRNG